MVEGPAVTGDALVDVDDLGFDLVKKLDMRDFWASFSFLACKGLV